MPQSVRKPLLAQLPSQCVVNPDEKAKFFVEWWQRMHHKTHPLVAVVLKFVEWANDGADSHRYVWEVCRWPQGRSSEWTFVCWMIDGYGMWMKSFPSKRAALAYFEQAPAVVMTRPTQAHVGASDAEPYRAAS